MIPGSPSSDDSNSGGFNKLRRRKLSFRRRTEKGNPSSLGLISQCFTVTLLNVYSVILYTPPLGIIIIRSQFSCL